MQRKQALTIKTIRLLTSGVTGKKHREKGGCTASSMINCVSMFK